MRADLWIKDVTITTGLVDTFTIPTLLDLIAARRIDPVPFTAHRFPLGDAMAAYDTFAHAADTNAMKVLMSRRASPTDDPGPATLPSGYS
jgi:alcohol dehydrogenase